MFTFAAITAAIKAASGLFQKMSEKERLAALAQAQFLDDAAADLLELTDAYKNSGTLEPYLVSKVAVSMGTSPIFPDIEDLKAQTKAAAALISSAYKSQTSGAPVSLAKDDVRKLEELAGLLRGAARITRTVAEASKQSGGWI